MLHLHQPRQIYYNTLMATFNTAEELIRILDEDPELLEALRARLLTRELLDLPAAHAAFVAEMHAFVAEMHEFVAEMHEFVAATNRRFEAIELRLDRLEEKVTGLDEKVTELDEKVTGLDEKVTELRQDVTRIDRRVIRLGNDFGVFRGSYAENAARKKVDTIVIQVGNAKGIEFDEFTVRALDSDALKDKARAFPGIADIPQGARLSFYESDLVAEVRDSEGETHYIVVEASFTCDETDTERAVSHASLLTKFTRKNAYAVVAGVRIDDEIRQTVESGDVIWYEIDDKDLKP